MHKFAGLALAALMMPGAAQAGEAGDALIQNLYSGTASTGLPDAEAACAADDAEGCFAAGLLSLVTAYEGLAADFYRHGAVFPGDTPASLLFGLGMPENSTPANPEPEPLTYEGLRTVLEDFVGRLDAAQGYFRSAGALEPSSDYVVLIDPLKVQIDFNGDGTLEESESLGALLNALDYYEVPGLGGGKTKPITPLDTSVGFDRADAFWFTGYSQVTAAPVDLLLAHDFSAFFDAYMHRVFPRAGLPLQEHTDGGVLFLDPEGDAGIADMIASIHTLNFPVSDQTRLSGVLDRLKTIPELSRQNWAAIRAETDDNRELVPNAGQTSIFPDMPVTEETIDAWLATLDRIDEILDGELLLPHWRFDQGFDLAAYFTTATNTDLVMLLTGLGALPYLKDGPIANAETFAEANRVLGDSWFDYAIWFN